MKVQRLLLHAALTVALLLIALAPAAAQYPAAKEGSWIARDFRFHTGEVMSELRLHYRTIGEPSGEPVLILHGTTGSGASMLSPAFAGELFGPGGALDASKHFIILPDAIGHGKSSKPSDGMRAKFPRYNYDDMVAAQYKLVTEGLGVRRVRLVLGNSMGGMHTWIWGVAHPEFMDALVPMASQPTEMSSRNWMMRRLIIDTIRKDPEWKDGNYATQPSAFRAANVFYGIATNGGTLAYQKQAPTRELADKLLDQRLAAPFTADANDIPVCLGLLARLQPVARSGAHSGCAAGDQFRGRRAQPAGDRHHGPRAQAREERPPLPDPGQRGHARPRHDRHGQVLEAASAGVLGDGAPASDVSLPLPACGERVGVRGSRRRRSNGLPLTLTLSPLKSGERELAAQSAMQTKMARTPSVVLN